jgi:hypothetical protein
MFTAYQLHLPSEVRCFHYHVPPSYVGAEAIVFDGFLSPSEPIACRSYLFFNRWLEVFITFDEHLALAADPTHPFPFAFNCDITTPYYRVDHHLFTTDLCIDILVAPDGRTYQVEDTDEFTQWYAHGAFGAAWYVAAQREVAAVTELLDTQQFVAFLNAIAPFPTHRPRAQLSTMEQPDLAATPFVAHPHYARYR